MTAASEATAWQKDDLAAVLTVRAEAIWRGAESHFFHGPQRTRPNRTESSLPKVSKSASFESITVICPMELLTWRGSPRAPFEPRHGAGMRGGDLIREVFGSDSDSDDADELNHPGPSPPSPLMRPGCVVETPLGADACVGMFVAREALGEDARRWLLDSIRADDLVDFPDDEPSTAAASAASDRCAHTGGARNQAMRFGRDHLPRWALALAEAVAKLATRRPGDSHGEDDDASADHTDDDDAVFPREVLARARTASGVFNQMIVNQYAPGEGLAPHVDLDAFADGVAVVSLRSTVVMDMYPPGSSRDRIPGASSAKPVWLRPGDVMFLSRAARWEWAHGIAARDADPVEGETGEGARVRRGCRTSVTLRAMREDGHELRVPA